jgi:hypothetical protein
MLINSFNQFCQDDLHETTKVETFMNMVCWNF